MHLNSINWVLESIQKQQAEILSCLIFDSLPDNPKFLPLEYIEQAR